MTEKKTRRRGAALENDILAAAWAQLQEKGYQSLTIEGVAEAAATTKTVLYRRWPDKAHLVIAVLSHEKLVPPYVSPDTGSLRSDFLDLFGQMAGFLAKLNEETFRGLLADRLKTVDFSQLLTVANDGSEMERLVQPILDHAAARGEISRAKWPARVVRLPAILLINEIFSHQTLTNEAQQAMVDEILLPVFGGKTV
ncbi:TetR/AcrR family transcriptional regulator [Levilactobacillus yonginensis]|uniref:TetR/AcrR family transcriptional regulator n=1 Tax=Levilactobacillus yonginensis TaxID=1054041 RepID=UPI00345CC744